MYKLTFKMIEGKSYIFINQPAQDFRNSTESYDNSIDIK